MNPPRKSEKVWNLFTLFVLAGIVALAGWFALIYRDPQSQLNPYPPPTLPAVIQVMIASETPAGVVEPTIQPFTQTITVTSTSTPLPTWTDLPFQATQNALQTLATQTDVPENGYRYAIQGEPAAIAAVLLNSSRQDCDWMGVGGQVLDMEGRPVTGILVQLGGTLARQAVNQFSLTGTALNYGPSGYEFQIATLPTASTQTLYVRLFDQSNIALSGKAFFDTYEDADCSRNLIIINFKQLRP
jgi:hypothetical protein